MAINTEFLGLKKPSQEDFYNIDDFNENFQKIDDFAKRKDNPHGVTALQVGALPYDNNYHTTDTADSFIGQSCIVRGTFRDIPTNVGGVNLGDAQGTLITLNYVNEWTKQFFISAHVGMPIIERDGNLELGMSEWYIPCLSTKGGIVTGTLKNENKSGYSAVDKVRTVNGTDYMSRFGLGNISNVPATSLELTDTSGTISYARFDIFEDKITYEPFNDSKKELYGEHNASKFGISRTKTGTYKGGGDGVTIPTDFNPKLLVVGGKSKGSQQKTFCVPYDQSSVTITVGGTDVIDINKIVWSEDSISWNGSGGIVANESGEIYHYTVIG